MQNKLNQIEDVSVLIVGGGITGLTACLFLLQQGITPILIEKHKATSIHPRSRGFDIRAMELLREAGLSFAIREAGKALGPAWGILRGDNLIETLAINGAKENGKVTFPTQLAALKALAELTPEEGARCTQDIAEPILLQAAIDRGARIFFDHEMISFDHHDQKVSSLIRNRLTGEDHVISADYMIAADGSKSPVRKALGIKTGGQGKIADFLNVYFEADLAGLVKGREFSLFLIDTPELIGFLTSINNSNKWVFQLQYDPDSSKNTAHYTSEVITAIIRKSIGDEDLDIRIISVMPWKMEVRVATSMQQNRIFIAGDAAHVMTPYGGKGANTGIQDVHNLAWKLATVICKTAGSDLLKTYHSERYPVGEYYAIRSGQMAAPNGLVKEKVVMAHMKSFIGLPDYRYESTAIIGGKSAVQSETDMYEILGYPGTRFPHIWLDAEKQLSSLDLIKGHFLLIQNSHNNQRTALIASMLDEQKLIASLITVSDYPDIADAWRELLNGLNDHELILVRPDGFIAWKGEFHKAADLRMVIKAILSKE